MDKQAVIDTLHNVLLDRKEIERKLRTLIRDQRIDAHVLAIALTRLENFEDDIRIVIDDIEQ